MNKRNRSTAETIMGRAGIIGSQVGLFSLLLVLMLFYWLPSSTTQERFSGQWRAELEAGGRLVRISLNYPSGKDDNNNSFDIELDKQQDLTLTQVMSKGSPVRFRLSRDAGTIICEGLFREGKGSGRFTFVSNTNFAAELNRLGYGIPSEEQQFFMTLYDVNRAFIKELRTQGYKQISLESLIETGIHGIRVDYVTGLKALGYQPQSVELLIELFDHDVSLDFIKGLEDLGYAHLAIAQLMEVKDHAVDFTFIRELKQLGYTDVPLKQLIRLRDHNVTIAFIAGVRAQHHQKINLEDLIRMRDEDSSQN
jgi:hypothetical protein